jgi:hypothetical protein
MPPPGSVSVIDLGDLSDGGVMNAKSRLYCDAMNFLSITNNNPTMQIKIIDLHSV